MEKTVDVSIIVPCRNEVKTIAETLESIRSQDPVEGGFEVIVADGMSNDGTRDLLKQLVATDPRITMVDNPEGIVSTGLNRAIRLARGKIIIRMDAHTTYACDYVRRCVEVLRETNADNVGGPWIARGSGIIGRAIAAAFGSSFAVGGARSHDSLYEGPVDSVYLGCWPRKSFERFGLFDENMVRNQDDELNLRINRGGGKIWQSPRIKCLYNSRSSLGGLFRQYLQYGYWKVRILQKHKLPASIRHLVPMTFLLGLFCLPLLALRFAHLWWVWFVMMGCYMAGLLLASSITSFKAGNGVFFYLPAVFICFHFAYGLGFLKGVLDVVVLRRNTPSRYMELTRQ